MFPYNIVENQGDELIRKCQEKNVGFIAMKPLAGGAIENGSLALRYVCSNQAVTVVIPGMAEVSELEENIKACSDTAPLTEAELAENGTDPPSAGHQFLPSLQLLCAMYGWNQHPKRIPFRRISGTLPNLADWGERPLRQHGSESFCMCGMRQVRDKMPISSANPGNAEEGCRRIWRIIKTALCVFNGFSDNFRNKRKNVLTL